MMDKFKDTAQKMVFDRMVEALEKLELTEAQMVPIARFTLDNTPLITNQQQLVHFLKQLATKWPLFKNLATIEQGKHKQTTESQAAKNVLHLIKKGHLQQAITIAKEANKSS